MAPEIVRGEAVPSTQTDLFSLSVLIFYMLMVAHPLEGAKEAAIKALDLPAMTKIYGKEPIFIFDPNDDSNRPVPGIHDNALAFWRIYPQFLRDIFIRAFTIGIKRPEKRARPRKRMARDDGASCATRFFIARIARSKIFTTRRLLKRRRKSRFVLGVRRATCSCRRASASEIGRDAQSRHATFSASR
jgi:serine/threonine protein kinase